MITLYSTDCPKCKVLEKKLDDKGITYTINSDIEEMKNLGFTSVPWLVIDDITMDFGQAVKWVNEYDIDNNDCSTCKN